MSSASKELDDIQSDWDEEDKKEKQMKEEDKLYGPMIEPLLSELLQNDEKQLSTIKKDILSAIVEKSGLRASKLYKFLFSVSNSCNSVSCPHPIAQAVNDSGNYLSSIERGRMLQIGRNVVQAHKSKQSSSGSSKNMEEDSRGKNTNRKLFGGFFFSKKKTQKRRKKKTKGKKKKKRKSKKKNKKTRKHPKEPNNRKFTDTSYPYRIINKKQAIKEFLSLREMVKKKDFNSKSVLGNRVVDYGTEKMRKKTKYRNKSHYERWQDKVAREKVIKFARRLYKKGDKRTIESSIRGAIELQWGSVNTMRPAAAACAYKKNKATKVLDFTAGWGARLVAAMAMDIDYIGIDANTALKPGYDKIIKLLKPYSKSKVKMIFKKAETVDISKLKYDFVFTSPPYEYLEVYENMENYEKKGEKVSQPYSSSKIKLDDSEKFYDEFMIPTLKRIYKHLPKGKHICLNMPDIMYTKIKKKWKKADKKDVYSIVGRVGGPEDFKRLEKEQIFCWKKH